MDSMFPIPRIYGKGPILLEILRSFQIWPQKLEFSSRKGRFLVKTGFLHYNVTRYMDLSVFSGTLH